MKDIRSIVIIKPSALGDIVLALPALHALRQRFPQAKISWLVRPEYAALLASHPDLNEIIIFDRKGLAKWWCNRTSFKMLTALVRQLRAGKFDVVFDFQGLLRSALCGWLSGGKIRVGIKGAREGACLFYNRTVAQEPGTRHLVDHFMKMVEAITAAKSTPEFILPSSRDAQQSVMDKVGADAAKGGYAVLVPGSAKANKCWPTECFAKVGDFVARQYGWKIVAVGSKGEMNLTGAIAAASEANVIDLGGKTSIAELIELMRNARLVISNDTGPGHIAAALGTAVVFVFGPTNPARVYPYNRPDWVVAKNAFGRGFEADNPEPEYAIERIKVDDVTNRIQTILRTP